MSYGRKRVVNLTPHSILVLRDDHEGSITGVIGSGPTAREAHFSVVIEFPPSGTIARATQTDQVVGGVEACGKDISVVRTVFGETIDLPHPEVEVMLIVSAITAQAAKALGRPTDDLLMTSDIVRDKNGRLIGIRRFSTL